MSHRALLLPLLLFFGMCHSAIAQPDGKQSEAAAHASKAQQYLREQRPDLAIPELEALLKLRPSDLEAQANLGVLLYFRGNTAQAIPHLRAAVAGGSELWKIQGLLGLAEARAGDATRGRADMETAFPHLTEQKFKTEVGNALVASYGASGDTEKAATIISALLADQPMDPALLFASYRIYSDLADKAMVTMALSAPDSALMHAMMARELARHGDEAQAIVNYREALKQNPHLSGAHFDLGNLLYNSSNEQLQSQATAEFQAALADNPNDAKAHLMLGEAATKRGDANTAYTEDSRAVELQPNDTDALLELGKVLMTRNEDQRAEQLFTQAVQADPSNTVAHYRLSMLYRRQGKTADAEREMAEYKKYKAMKSKLETIFHDMRVGSLQKSADDADPSR
jgi:tetratricopeptide (TPR) repeat protein